MNQADYDINVKKTKTFMKNKYNEFSRQKNSSDKNLPYAGHTWFRELGWQNEFFLLSYQAPV